MLVYVWSPTLQRHILLEPFIPTIWQKDLLMMVERWRDGPDR